MGLRIYVCPGSLGRFWCPSSGHKHGVASSRARKKEHQRHPRECGTARVTAAAALKVEPASDYSTNGALRRGSSKWETPCSRHCSKDAYKEKAINAHVEET